MERRFGATYTPGHMQWKKYVQKHTKDLEEQDKRRQVSLYSARKVHIDNHSWANTAVIALTKCWNCLHSFPISSFTVLYSAETVRHVGIGRHWRLIYIVIVFGQALLISFGSTVWHDRCIGRVAKQWLHCSLLILFLHWNVILQYMKQHIKRQPTVP